MGTYPQIDLMWLCGYDMHLYLPPNWVTVLLSYPLTTSTLSLPHPILGRGAGGGECLNLTLFGCSSRPQVVDHRWDVCLVPLLTPWCCKTWDHELQVLQVCECYTVHLKGGTKGVARPTGHDAPTPYCTWTPDWLRGGCVLIGTSCCTYVTDSDEDGGAIQ